jgi:hypothetical protein
MQHSAPVAFYMDSYTTKLFPTSPWVPTVKGAKWWPKRTSRLPKLPPRQRSNTQQRRLGQLVNSQFITRKRIISISKETGCDAMEEDNDLKADEQKETAKKGCSTCSAP